jgi:uncharacterized protein
MSEFIEQYGEWALVAGASEGIGKSFANRLAARGMNLVLLARRVEVLAQVKAELEAAHGVEVVVRAVDLTAPDLADTLADIAAQHDIGLLVYNAGAAHGAATFMSETTENLLSLVHLNCTGPILMVKQFAGPMLARKRGGIILLSSLSALSGGAYIATYAATKAFDMILAEGLWDEMRGSNVHVLGLVAGATSTPAMLKSGVVFAQGAEGQEQITPMTSDQVADEGLANLGKKPVHIAGEKNFAAAVALRSAADRVQTIQYMGTATASLFGKPYPTKD